MPAPDNAVGGKLGGFWGYWRTPSLPAVAVNDQVFRRLAVSPIVPTSTANRIFRQNGGLQLPLKLY